MDEAHGSERRTTRRQPQRKPLGDLTNTPSLSSSSSAAATATSLVKPKPSDPKPSRSSARCASTIRSSGDENPADQGILDSTPKAKQVSADSNGDAVTRDKVEDSIVYMRRSKEGRKGKGKAVAVAISSSCPPIGRIRSTKGKLNVEDGEVDLPKEFSVPCEKIKKRRYTMPEEPHESFLPQDFVEKQRAYFAEIDAFELQEEEVSESELE